MQANVMNLRILVPFELFAAHSGVLRMVAETDEGSFGLLPRRRDCSAVLAPGILIWETETAGESYLAVDQGVLIKTGADVMVSVRRAIVGTDLEQLRQSVAKEFLTLNEQEQSVHAVMAKLETGFLRRFANFQNE
ncbi:MAG: F0F1 ATP synthase subunit epsilon [Xanthomonadales bacterium]|nr:F0F1 ATP synthase subunit epsilon [Xanthomonadales bacterium]